MLPRDDEGRPQDRVATTKSSLQRELGTRRASWTHTAYDMTVAGTSRQRQVATTVKSALSRAPHDRWATRVGRSPGLRLERFVPAFPRVQEHQQWHNGRSSPLTVAGAAAACWRTELRSSNHRVPFSPTDLESPAGTDTRGQKAVGAAGSQRGAVATERNGAPVCDLSTTVRGRSGWMTVVFWCWIDVWVLHACLSP